MPEWKEEIRQPLASLKLEPVFSTINVTRKEISCARVEARGQRTREIGIRMALGAS